MKKVKNEFNIEKVQYKILNPGGNLTALVNGCDYTLEQKKNINKIIMEKYPQIEQVGFLSNDEKRLEMAGGEFCLNASRCAIYEYSKRENNEISLSVSGTNQQLLGKLLNKNTVEVKMNIGRKIDELIDKQTDLICINLSGILIAIMDEKESKKYIDKLKENEKQTKEEIKKLIMEKINSSEKAVGIVLLEKIFNKIKINPIVWVKDIDTCFYETACGSGSLGLAIYNYFLNKEEQTEIVQPSGYSINIKLEISNLNIINSAIIRGIVEEV